jgi:hypothetical protein
MGKVRVDPGKHWLSILPISEELLKFAPQEQSILVQGIPPYYHTAALSQIFDVFGPVQTCIFPEAMSRMEFERDIQYRRAIIVFLNSEDRDRALSHESKDDILPGAEFDLNELGMDRLIHRYHASRPDPAELASTVEEFMSVFDAEEKNKLSDEPQVDEDGFTLVTSSNRRKKRVLPRINGISEFNQDEDDNRAKKKSDIVGAGFYRTSQKAAKLEQIASLQARFAKDRAQIRNIPRKGIS